MLSGEPLFILLIEDDDDHAELVIRNFQKHRIANKVIRVADGEEAIDYLFHKNKYSDVEKYPLPNLILLDLRMPKIDGIEVLKIIKNSEELKEIPVVILTSSQCETDIRNAYRNYTNSYIVKPLDFEKFNQLIKDLGFYWLGWNCNIKCEKRKNEKRNKGFNY
ncbi:MAG TPA: response regulator [bacterium]|nr:response regulator [bacterium]HOL48359.1 response regulator [bacterium]HPQ18017.1 response regulator [bacterium]